MTFDELRSSPFDMLRHRLKSQILDFSAFDVRVLRLDF